LNKIITNNDTSIIKLDFEYFNKILNSLNKKLHLIFHTINDREIKTHREKARINTINILIQFNDINVQELKILKMFVIIFNFMKFYIV